MRPLLALLCLLWSAPAWALAGWAFQRTITVDNSGNTNPLVDYPVDVILTPANFTFANAAPDGRDVRYTLADGTTQLLHCERAGTWNATSVTSTVSVPLVAASSTTTIKIWYGNPAAGIDSYQDCTSTFSPPGSTPVLTIATNGVFAYPFAPKIVKCSTGKLLVAYTDGSTNDNNDDGVYYMTSSDSGATWTSPPTLLLKAPGQATYAGAMGVLASGTVMLTVGVQTIGGAAPYDGDVYVFTSTDCGSTWSAPVGPIHNNFPHGQYSYGKIQELTPGGTLITSVFGWDAASAYIYLELLQSVDGGANWTTRGTIANTPGRILDETSVLCTTATHCIAAIRDDTLALHSMYTTTSDDGGATWAALRWVLPSYFKIWVSPDLIQLADGQIMLCVGERPLTATGKGVRCLISRDGGLTWPEGNQIFAAEAGTTSPHVGYPSTVQLVNGSFVTVLYAHQPTSTGTVSVLVTRYNQRLVQQTKGRFDGGETGNLSAWGPLSVGYSGNSVTVPTTQPHSGHFSLFFNDADTSVFLSKYLGYSTTAAATTSYPETGAVSLWAYVPAVPQAVDVVVMDPDVRARFILRVLPTGIVKFVNAAGAETALPTPTTITLNAWHKVVINFSMLVLPSQGTASVRIDGSDVGTITHNTPFDGYLGSVGIRTGKLVADTGDQAYIDDAQFLPYAPVLPTSSVGAESGAAVVYCP